LTEGSLYASDNKIGHLRDKESFRTTKPQKPVKWTIDNSKLGSNRDIGMTMKHNLDPRSYKRSL
jgi:hypothetical protein